MGNVGTICFIFDFFSSMMVVSMGWVLTFVIKFKYLKLNIKNICVHNMKDKTSKHT